MRKILLLSILTLATFQISSAERQSDQKRGLAAIWSQEDNFKKCCATEGLTVAMNRYPQLYGLSTIGLYWTRKFKPKAAEEKAAEEQKEAI